MHDAHPGVEEAPHHLGRDKLVHLVNDGAADFKRLDDLGPVDGDAAVVLAAAKQLWERGAREMCRSQEAEKRLRQLKGQGPAPVCRQRSCLTYLRTRSHVPCGYALLRQAR